MVLIATLTIVLSMIAMIIPSITVMVISAIDLRSVTLSPRVQCHPVWEKSRRPHRHAPKRRGFARKVSPA